MIMGGLIMAVGLALLVFRRAVARAQASGQPIRAMRSVPVWTALTTLLGVVFVAGGAAMLVFSLT